MIRTYSELITLKSFDERFEYLKLNGYIGESTFGFDRWLNQVFYKSAIWLKRRREIILRDEGYDLGVRDPNEEIQGIIVVHHMNPIEIDDLENYNIDALLNPEFLISTADMTHKAIHYSTSSSIQKSFIERKPNDTCPWRL